MFIDANPEIDTSMVLLQGYLANTPLPFHQVTSLHRDIQSESEDPKNKT
jgi:hypothetical protein